MKTIYLVRHGEAEINPTAEKKAVLVTGGFANLTPRGFIQAEKVAERMANLPLQVLLASTMVRAQQTATVISKRIDMPFESSDLFTEMREPSSYIGRVWDDPETQRLFGVWKKTLSAEGGRVEDGENFDDINARANEALAFLAARPEEHIAVVTHGYFMKVLLSRIFFGDTSSPDLVNALQDRLRTVNTGLTIAHYDPADARAKWWVSIWNDHAHLG